MMDRFPACLAETLKLEGGYSNIKEDPGGPTMCGIIQVEYDAYRDRCKLPRQSVRKITREEYTAIYRANYWVPMRADELPPGIDLAAWDMAVNSGCGQAIKSLQRVLGVAIDGHLGSLTMDAIHRAEPTQLIHAYMNERRRFLRQLVTFWRFGRGWMARCDEIEASALAAVSGMPAQFHAASVEPSYLLPADPDERSAAQGKAPAETPAPPVTAEAGLTLGGLGGLSTAAPQVIEKAAASGKVTATSLLLAVLTEPLFWVGMVALWGAVAAYLWRRQHHA